MKRTLVLLFIIIFIILLLPVIFYIWKFSNTPISSDPQVWGVMGDFFGGILNPFISLVNLSVLGYLTYLIAEQTNKESKNIFIMERRMLAYDELAKHLKNINSFNDRLKDSIASASLPGENAIEQVIKAWDGIRTVFSTYREFYFTLFEFFPRYGFLFKYDFKSKEYQDLLSETKKISNTLSKLIERQTVSPNDEYIPERFLSLVSDVIINLRKEVEIKLD